MSMCCIRVDVPIELAPSNVDLLSVQTGVGVVGGYPKSAMMFRM